MLEYLSHLGSISSPVLTVIGVLYLRYEIIKLKLWVTANFTQKPRSRIM